MNATSLRSLPLFAVLWIGGLIAAAPAGAQTRVPKPPPAQGDDVCVSIDEARDTLSAAERTAARLLVEKQFTAEGWHVVPEGCPATYWLSHIRLGRTISVTMSGPNGKREGSALGLDDLPALYSQMVRSIVTGRPMETMGVIDRTNVTTFQALPPNRVASERFTYARLGFGNLGPVVGLGYRAEISSVALDISFAGLGAGSSSFYSNTSQTTGTSLLKVEAFRFTNRTANASTYYGGGVSWGVASHTEGLTAPSWHGSGLQAELTGGYEVGRASTLRVFVQADATVPFFRLTSFSDVSTRYSPSIVVSVGVGWQHERR